MFRRLLAVAIVTAFLGSPLAADACQLACTEHEGPQHTSHASGTHEPHAAPDHAATRHHHAAPTARGTYIQHVDPAAPPSTASSAAPRHACTSGGPLSATVLAGPAHVCGHDDETTTAVEQYRGSHAPPALVPMPAGAVFDRSPLAHSSPDRFAVASAARSLKTPLRI